MPSTFRSSLSATCSPTSLRSIVADRRSSRRGRWRHWMMPLPVRTIWLRSIADQHAGALARRRGRSSSWSRRCRPGILTGTSVDRRLDPEMAVDRHRNAHFLALRPPARRSLRLAAAGATKPRSSRKVNRTKPPPKIATQASAMSHNLASGSRRDDQRAEHQHHRHQQIEAAEHHVVGHSVDLLPVDTPAPPSREARRQAWHNPCCCRDGSAAIARPEVARPAEHRIEMRMGRVRRAAQAVADPHVHALV